MVILTSPRIGAIVPFLIFGCFELRSKIKFVCRYFFNVLCVKINIHMLIKNLCMTYVLGFIFELQKLMLKSMTV